MKNLTMIKLKQHVDSDKLYWDLNHLKNESKDCFKFSFFPSTLNDWFKLDIPVIKKLRHSLARKSLLTIYKAFLPDLVDYGDIIYDQPCYKVQNVCKKKKKQFYLLFLIHYFINFFISLILFFIFIIVIYYIYHF